MGLFGMYLKYHRTQQGVSLRSLAELMKVNPSILSRLERGEIATPSEDILSRLPEAINRPPAEVYLAAQRITPDLAIRLERGVPDLVAQLGKVLEEVEQHVTGLAELPAVPLDQALDPADAAAAQRAVELGSDLSEILAALLTGVLSQERFDHLAQVIKHLKAFALHIDNESEEP